MLHDRYISPPAYWSTKQVINKLSCRNKLAVLCCHVEMARKSSLFLESLTKMKMLTPGRCEKWPELLQGNQYDYWLKVKNICIDYCLANVTVYSAWEPIGSESELNKAYIQKLYVTIDDIWRTFYEKVCNVHESV